MEQKRTHPKLLSRDHVEYPRPLQHLSKNLMNTKDPPHYHHRSVLNKPFFANKTPEIIRQHNSVRKCLKVGPEGDINNMNKNVRKLPTNTNNVNKDILKRLISKKKVNKYVTRRPKFSDVTREISGSPTRKRYTKL